jgi:hypothetical protein
VHHSSIRNPWRVLPLFFAFVACGRNPSAQVDDVSDEVVAPEARAAQALVVYDDQPENGFADGGWGTYVLKDKTHVYSGTYAMKLTPTNYDGVHLQRSNGSLASGTYLAVDFWVYGIGSGGQQLWVGVTGSPSGTYNVLVNNYISGGKIPANQWTHVVAPISAMGASHVAIASVYVMAAKSATQSAVWIDQVTLTTSNSSGGRTVKATGTASCAASSSTELVSCGPSTFK